MVLALIALVAGAATGWAAGRRLPQEARPRGTVRPGRGWAGTWRAVWLVPAGAALAVTGERWVGGGAGVAVALPGYVLLCAFALLNHRHAGLVLVAAGLLANLVVIGVDGGMPVRGQPAGVGGTGLHHGLSSRDRLSGLADTVRLAPLSETVSPGDLLVALGGAVAVYSWLEPVPATARRPRRPARRRGAEPAGS